MTRERTNRWRWRAQRRTRPLAIAFGVVAAFVAWELVPAWWEALPRWVTRGLALGFLHGFLLLYVVGLATAALGLVGLVPWLIRARRRGARHPWIARAIALCVASLIGFGLLEGASAALEVWTRRPIPMPPPPPDDPANRLPNKALGGSPNELRLVVFGESSARGVPFDPWISIGQIVAWQLEHVFPDRKVVLESRASNGSVLRPMVERLATLEHRPDAVLLYSGHNEFQSKFGWSRVVDYYPEDRRIRPRSLVDRLCAQTPLLRLIGASIQKQRIDLPPSPVRRSLVDRPTVTADEYATLRSDYHRDLETFAAYLERLGALPILIVPAGNEAGFGPNRSVLPEQTRRPQRETFTREVLAAKALEATEPARAEARYRDLIARQPGFAETHFRLARLLEASDRWDEAKRQYRLARDLDALPVRCPSDFQSAYREVEARHDVVVVDANAVLPRLHPHGLLDDLQFSDIQHASFRGYLALAQEVLDQLYARRAFGWPDGVPAPVVDPDECAAHFGLDAQRWQEICRHSAILNGSFVEIRYDPTEREARTQSLRRAAREVARGRAPDQLGVRGLGVHPPGLHEPAHHREMPHAG